jgi:DNA-binding NtrC family response regulator
MSAHGPVEKAVVLVVEDEILIREDVIDILERNGFEALRAGTVGQALAALAERPDIQAVFTDIQMPGTLDGTALARHVVDRRPEMAVLVTSGRSYAAPEYLPPGTRFLPKPYMPGTVVRILRDMIREQSDDAGGWNPGFGRSDGDRGSSASPP